MSPEERISAGDAIAAKLTAETTATAEVGDTLLVWGPNRYSGVPREVTVTKVGRKWLTTESDWASGAQFAIKTGRPQYEFSQGERAYGQLDWEMRKLAAEASETIEKAGLTIRFGGDWSDANKVRLAVWLRQNIL